MPFDMLYELMSSIQAMPNAVPIQFRWRLQLVQHCLPAKGYMAPPVRLLVSKSDQQLHGTAASSSLCSVGVVLQ